MKIKTIFFITVLSVMTIIGLYFCKVQKGHISGLVYSNVEALAQDEWGGGHWGPDGPGWYSYVKTTYQYQNCSHPELPGYICECVVKTCHGYGDLFCNGSITCY